MNKFVVGVTGGIGAGKTAVTNQFAQLGIEVVDADIVAREVVAPGMPALEEIKKAFGSSILDEQGQLNRAKLRKLVFTDDTAKETLNRIMHPAIRSCLIAQLQHAQSDYVILSAPLLLENELDTYVDALLVIDVPESVQVARASARDGVTAEQIRAIMDNQCTRVYRQERADYLLDNSGELALLPAKVKLLHQEFVQKARDLPTGQ